MLFYYVTNKTTILSELYIHDTMLANLSNGQMVYTRHMPNLTSRFYHLFTTYVYTYHLQAHADARNNTPNSERNRQRQQRHCVMRHLRTPLRHDVVCYM